MDWVKLIDLANAPLHALLIAALWVMWRKADRLEKMVIDCLQGRKVDTGPDA